MDNSDPNGSGTNHGQVTTEEDLQEVLEAVLAKAKTNGVDIHGTWPLTSDESSGAVEVTIEGHSDRSTVHSAEQNLTISTITEAIMEREDVDTTDLPPLHTAINPDLLELLYDPTGERSDQYLTFEYAGYRITACSDGTVVLDR